MKYKVILLLCVLLTCHHVQAQSQGITLIVSDNKDTWLKDDRSLSLLVSAMMDGNIIVIQTSQMVDEISIAISDTMGNIVFSSHQNNSSRTHTFFVENLSAIKGTIEVCIESKTYIGAIY